MKSVTYAILAPEAEAAKYGKKGTASDVTLYNAKKGDDHLNLVTASRFPEKLPSLLAALDLADEILLQPSAMDRALGETIVACELMGRTSGFVRPSPQVPLEVLRPVLAKTALKSLTEAPEAEAVFRERLFERAAAPEGGSLILPVDHAFPVKGVGTVVLGLVRAGQVNAHDLLQAYPGDKKVDVRSIQVHDMDQKSAGIRCRVGLAVKGIEAADLPRGTVLAPPGSLKPWMPEAPRTVDVRLASFSNWQPRAGAVVHLFHVLQDVVVRVENVEAATKESAKLTLKVETPLAVVPGQPAVLVDLDNPKQRLIGRVAL